MRYYPTHDFQSCALDQLSHLSTQAVNGLIIQRGEGKVKIKSFALAGVSLTERGCAGGPGRPGQQQKRARENCQEREKDAAQAAAAVRCLHTAFELDSDSVFEETQLSAEEIAAKMNKGR